MAPFFRVPLLYPSVIVLRQLSVKLTSYEDPPGDPTVGYDPDFHEPYPYEDSGEFKDTRQYLSPVRVPCQVEVKPFEEVQQVVQGNAHVTEMTFVLHRKDLRRLGLVCSLNGTHKIPLNSKVTSIEHTRQACQTTKGLRSPLYIVEIRPGSWGMGPDGYDLEVCYTATRPAVPST